MHERLSRAGVPLLPYARRGREIPVAADRQAFAQLMERTGIALPDDLPLSCRRSYYLPPLDRRRGARVNQGGDTHNGQLLAPYPEEGALLVKDESGR